MRQISNEFMVLSQQDARDILAAIVGSACMTDAQMKALCAFTEGSMGGHVSRHFYSAADLMTPAHSEIRLRYVIALCEEVKALQANEQESQLLEQTKPLMMPFWTVSGRVAAIKRVREITGMDLSEAAIWVDLHYRKP